MLLAELMLAMAGHPSSLFPVVANTQGQEHGEQNATSPWQWTMQFSPKTPGLHPGERATLDGLARIAAKHRRIKLFAEKVQADIYSQVINEHKSGHCKVQDSDEKEARQCSLMAPLAACLLRILNEYQDTVLDTEADILRRRWDMVGDDQRTYKDGEAPATPFVSLANIRARFQHWKTPLTALDALVSTLLQGPTDASLGLDSDAKENVQTQASSLCPLLAPQCPTWQAGQLLDLLALCSQTGIGTVQRHMSSLLQSIEEAWRQPFISWMCYGEPFADRPIRAALRGTPIAVSTREIDTEQDELSTTWNKGEEWSLNRPALPSWIAQDTEMSQSILYVGRALARLAEHPRLDALLEPITKTHVSLLTSSGARPCSDPYAFKNAVSSIHARVAEFIWSNVLTREVLNTCFTTLGDVFLQRDGLLTGAMLDGLSQLRKQKMLGIYSTPSNAIRESDVDLALRRAMVDAGLEEIDMLRDIAVVMPQRHMSKGSPADSDNLESTPMQRFGGVPLGVPFNLSYKTPFPIDFILSPRELNSYISAHSFLLAINTTKCRLQESWLSLSKAQRSRRKFTSVGEGGGSKVEEKKRATLHRLACEFVREALWLMNTLIGHFQVDIIDAQYSSFLEHIRSCSTRSGARESLPARSMSKSSRHSSIHGASSTSTSGQDLQQSHEGGLDATGPIGDTLPSRSGMRYLHHELGALEVSSDTNDSYKTKQAGDNLNALSFATLQATHKIFIASLLDGLLLSDPIARSLIWHCLQTSLRFAVLIDRWGGDVLPELLSGNISADGPVAFDPIAGLDERTAVVNEVHATLETHIQNLFVHLSSSSSTASGSVINTLGPTSLSVGEQAHGNAKEIQPGMSSMNLGALRHHEQLLSRLDFNGAVPERAANTSGQH